MTNDSTNDSTSAAPLVALVTGASRGLGLALARFLALQGYRLVLDARNPEALGKARETLGDATVAALPGDVTDADHRRALVEAARGLGGLNLLVNNASTLGESPLPRLEALAPQTLREVLEVNVIAPLALVQEALPLLEASRGLIVNLSSDAALGGYAGWGGYGGSKAALDLVTKTLAAELGSKGVYAVAVDPGDMRTQMHQDAFPGEDISERPTPDATLPFWTWLLGQKPETVTGRRFRAQADTWELSAELSAEVSA